MLCGDARAHSQADLVLSRDGRIGATDLVLTTIPFPGLPAGSQLTQSANVTLPGNPDNPPPGFFEPDSVLLGLRIDFCDPFVGGDSAAGGMLGVF